MQETRRPFPAARLAPVLLVATFGGIAPAQTAGIPTPGTTNYPNGGLRRIDSATFATGETRLYSGVLDVASRFAYYGTGTAPGVVVKMALGSGTAPPARTGALTLQTGEDSLRCAVVDETAGYAYFGTYTSPASVVKVALGTGTEPPARIGAVVLQSGEELLNCAAIDTAAGFAYFGTFTSPARVIKVALGAGASPPTRAGAVTLSAGESNLGSAVIDPAAGFAYFGTVTSPGRVVKVALGSGPGAPTRAGAVTLAAGEDSLHTAVIDAAAGYGYFGALTSPARVVKVALGTGSAAPSRTGAVTFEPGETGQFGAGAIDTAAGVAYFGTILNPGRVVKVALGSGGASPTRLGAITLGIGETNLRSALLDASTGTVYFAANSVAPGVVTRVAAGQNGFLKATRMTMPEPGFLESMHLYSHAASGNVRVAIYSDGTFRNRIWHAGPTANTEAGGFLDWSAADGTPANVWLPAGTYWLAWQVDSSVPVASYFGAFSGMGFLKPQVFGPEPQSLAPFDFIPTDEAWSQYITYTPGVAPQSEYWGVE